VHPRRHLKSLLGRLPVIGRRWDRVARRRWLLEQMPRDSVCAEIGVWKGDFSAAIVAVVRPAMLHLIDPWLSAGRQELEGVWYDRPQTAMDTIHDRVRGRFAREIAAGTVKLHRAPSAEAAHELADESLDWVYIDGDHTYPGVRGDIEAYAAKVRPGGFVCGDDYVVGGRFSSGVKRAVDEALANGLLTKVEIRDGQFILRRPPLAIPASSPADR
jgi:hypothetical protein